MHDTLCFLLYTVCRCSVLIVFLSFWVMLYALMIIFKLYTICELNILKGLDLISEMCTSRLC